MANFWEQTIPILSNLNSILSYLITTASVSQIQSCFKKGTSFYIFLLQYNPFDSLTSSCSHNFENIIIFDTIHVSVSKRLLVAWSETLVIQLLIYIELQNSSLQHHMAQLSKRLVCCIKCKTHSSHCYFTRLNLKKMRPL